MEPQALINRLPEALQTFKVRLCSPFLLCSLAGIGEKGNHRRVVAGGEQESKGEGVEGRKSTHARTDSDILNCSRNGLACYARHKR